jgi:hypothetical protein
VRRGRSTSDTGTRPAQRRSVPPFLPLALRLIGSEWSVAVEKLKVMIFVKISLMKWEAVQISELTQRSYDCADFLRKHVAQVEVLPNDNAPSTLRSPLQLHFSSSSFFVSLLQVPC